MAMNDAIRFLTEVTTNEKLRRDLITSDTHTSIENTLKNASFDFTSDELDDAYRNLLLKCSTEEQAGILREIKLWWDTLLFFTSKAVN